MERFRHSGGLEPAGDAGAEVVQVRIGLRLIQRSRHEVHPVRRIRIVQRRGQVGDSRAADAFIPLAKGEPLGEDPGIELRVGACDHVGLGRVVRNTTEDIHGVFCAFGLAIGDEDDVGPGRRQTGGQDVQERGEVEVRHVGGLEDIQAFVEVQGDFTARSAATGTDEDGRIRVGKNGEDGVRAEHGTTTEVAGSHEERGAIVRQSGRKHRVVRRNRARNDSGVAEPLEVHRRATRGGRDERGARTFSHDCVGGLNGEGRRSEVHHEVGEGGEVGSGDRA